MVDARRASRRGSAILLIALLLGRSFPCAAATAPTNEQLYDAAQQSFNAGRYAEARETLVRALDRRHGDPVGEQARMLLLQSDVYLGRLDEAEALVIQVRQERGEETHEDLLFWQAEIARKRGQYARARETYQQLLTENPQSPLTLLARYSLGLTWYEAGTFAEALPVFESLAAEARTADVERDARFMIGLTHYRLRRYQEAARSLRALLVEAPQFRQAAAARYYLGEAYYYLNDWLAAQQEYAASLAADAQGPLAPYASYGLGWALYQLKRYEAARAALERFLQARPTDPLADSARYAAAQCAHQLGDLEAAQRWFDEILARPGSADAPNEWRDEAWLGTGELLATQGNRSGAIALYEDAAQHVQDRAQRAVFHQRVAELLTQEQRLEEAQRAWTLAAEETPDPVQQRWAWLRAGDAAQARQRWEEAQAAYAQAVVGDEASTYATYVEYQRARLLRAQGRHPQAMITLQALLATHPRAEQADAAVAELAQIYADTGEWEAALTQWRALIMQYPRSPLVPQAYLSWGTVLMDRQQWAEAAERFQALARFFPEHPLAQQAVRLRAQALQLLGDPEAAERVVREYLGRPLPPETAIPLWIWLGQTAAAQSHGDEARRAWQTVVERWPAHALAAQALHQLAQAAREAGRPQEAEALWRRVVEQFPDNPWVLQARLALAGAALQQQDIEAAQRWLAPVTENAAAGVEDRLAVGDFWRHQDAWAQARAAYTPRPTDPPEATAHLLWLSGTIEEEAGQTEAALNDYRLLDERHPTTVWAVQGRLALGQLLERQEQWNAARQLYERVIARYPEEAGYARERLEALNPRR